MDVLPNEIIAIIFHLVEKDWRALSILSKRMRALALEEIVPVRILPMLLLDGECDDINTLLRYRREPLTIDPQLFYVLPSHMVRFSRQHPKLKHFFADRVFRQRTIEGGRFDIVAPLTVMECIIFHYCIPDAVHDCLLDMAISVPIGCCELIDIFTSPRMGHFLDCKKCVPLTVIPGRSFMRRAAGAIYAGGCGIRWAATCPGIQGDCGPEPSAAKLKYWRAHALNDAQEGPNHTRYWQAALWHGCCQYYTAGMTQVPLNQDAIIEIICEMLQCWSVLYLSQEWTRSVIHSIKDPSPAQLDRLGAIPLDDCGQETYLELLNYSQTGWPLLERLIKAKIPMPEKIFRMMVISGRGQDLIPIMLASDIGLLARVKSTFGLDFDFLKRLGSIPGLRVMHAVIHDAIAAISGRRAVEAFEMSYKNS